ncbi:MAG: glycosyltransferase family 2 protein [Patescibacteria group bacterium]|nr:glycosyltransferase family 2 protein [Patescibacteria group bacterium]
MPKLSIIIPVYNEKDTLLKILEKIEQVPLSWEREFILVDDFSTDGTREMIKNLPSRYKKIFHEKNSGKGAAIHSGLRLATGDYAIIQDADLEYDPNDYLKLIGALDAEHPVVYGSRNLADNPHFSIAFYYGGRLVTLAANLLFGSRLTDVNTCYKLAPVALLRSLNLEQARFSFCEEVTAKLLRRRIKIKEVPISYFPRKIEEGKKIRLSDGINAIVTLVKYRFKKIGRPDKIANE